MLERGCNMELKRQKEFVQAFYYEALPQDNTDETRIDVSMNPFEITEEMKLDPANNSVLGLRIEFQIILDKAKVSGDVAQFVQILNRKVDKVEDLTTDEVNELVRPLFSIIERMAYEVTEIALDQPGVKLNFSQE